MTKFSPKKICINGKEIEIEHYSLKVSSDKVSSDDDHTISKICEKIDKLPEPLYKVDENNWCNLIAWFMNCDELYFMELPTMRTAEDIFKSNSMGELMFVGLASQFLNNIVSQIVPKFPIEWKEKIEKCLAGEEVEPEERFATGFGLKCRTILWKTSTEFEDQVEEILKKNWN